MDNENSKEESKKGIIISGISNRYQIKRLTQERQILKKKNIDNIDKQYFNYDIQKEYISNAKDMDLLTKYSIYKTHIKNKISNYKQQDVLKKVYDKDHIITFSEVIELLHESNMCCLYCSENVFILYEISREYKQWTLDRIDNDKGHTKDNVVIACLECNLKRRKRSKDSFFFQKNLTITREGI